MAVEAGADPGRDEQAGDQGPGAGAPGYRGGWRASALLGVMVVVAMGALAFGPVGETFGGTGIMMLPLALLAMASYAGEGEEGLPWARLASVALLMAIALVATSGAVAQAEELSKARPGADGLGAIWLLALVGFGLGGAVFWGPARSLLARVTPIDRGRFVHAVALAGAIAISLGSLAPLVVLGEPPLTALAQLRADGEGPRVSPLYEHGSQLLWTLPTCVLLVGYGVRRPLVDCLRRLGLVAPSPMLVLRAAGLAVGLVVFASLTGRLVTSVFEGLGWTVTDQGGVETLMGGIISPVGALVVGVSAGLGEELMVRGVLQPRLGLLVSNLVFTTMHAGQYGWDLLIVIFCVGVGFGLVRKYSNTTMSALTHGLYDILLILAATAKG